ncbi:cobalamin biosynthesis protein CobD/CbiB [Lacimicrobium alkaliphilum]|uniref:Cobalamin biosynthesis protein CobD n=1 Tax=Lacimicrobium alkaliphilum TaxID=1526571 RepID=A0ABQ1QZ30_9ALTE|nr:cobalamin biosynthesis protein [Lacimicrobium alkaliphilum]GGD50558.1 cobalamin biosynthesis protein CobD [Lacimicrobium alkaliphilum]
MISNLFLEPLLQPVWLVLLVILIERLWLWPVAYHPLSFFRLLASRMADKVNRRDTDAIDQQRISGTLAPLVLLAPILISIGLFINLAEFPLFFDAVLLLMAIYYKPVLQNLHRAEMALKNNKKALARDLSARLLLRQTDSLSPMGLSKALTETTVLRFFYQFCTPLFWFFVGGGLAALTYRILYEFSQAWNTRQPRFRYFGQPVGMVVVALQALPVYLALFAFMLAENISGAITGRKQLNKGSCFHTRILALAGGALNLQLGGPAYYDGQKRRTQKCGGSRLPQIKDIRRAILATHKCTAILLCLVSLLYAGLFALGAGR